MKCKLNDDFKRNVAIIVFILIFVVLVVSIFMFISFLIGGLLIVTESYELIEYMTQDSWILSENQIFPWTAAITGLGIPIGFMALGIFSACVYSISFWGDLKYKRNLMNHGLDETKYKEFTRWDAFKSGIFVCEPKLKD
jgi:hypothetical protein